MTLLDDFAEWFEDGGIPVEDWHTDAKGRIAFDVTVKNTPFVCSARSPSKDRETSVMKELAGIGQTKSALIALRLGDTVRVFDPVSILKHGSERDAHDSDRDDRGEDWVYFPKTLGCRFDDWYDGTAEPTEYHDVSKF